jgi:DNA-directed RNA polymerase specialized sigma24 family protein
MPHMDNRRLDQVFDSNHRFMPRPEDRSTLILRRAAYLPPADRALVEAAVKSNLPRRQIARLLNLPAGTITRRLQRLGNRLHDPLVVALLDDRCGLPEDLRKAGISHFLQGQPMRRIARDLDTSLFQVRKMIEQLRGWHRGVHHRA